ncbi:AraC family transcriptional regulator [Mucilaginibacter terrenus]|uniref:AraC family transcriptional regulator n=1 Tax=Mucilaginibacter terrenus TaxID=2482727 RepID=A0A3E2NTN3_9SPHI|nr:helix-turn-helix transcriptional regulator [Mucilaginibacter terrenus]RFZ84368.1 AraC family transcriptional regulator [Mucilaginibacter terrenus]
MQNIETLAEFYQTHPVANQKIFSENNTGQGHFNVFLREPCKMRSPFSRRDFYKIVLILGKGKMHYTDKQVIVDRPALVFSSPSVTSSWESGPGEQKGWFCLFSQAFIESQGRNSILHDFAMFKPGGSHIVFPDEAQLTFLTGLLRRMMEEMDGEYIHKYDLLRNYLQVLMHEALKMSPVNTFEPNASAAARITTRFLELLERQFPIDPSGKDLNLNSAQDFAQSLAVHTNHLNRSVKEITGKTTTQHISERILKEANALLKHTDWSIAQVANALGFEEPAYFTSFFKKSTGVSPVMYRTANTNMATL